MKKLLAQFMKFGVVGAVAFVIDYGLLAFLTEVFVGLAYVALLCLAAESGWWSDAYPWAYQALLETFQFWT